MPSHINLLTLLTLSSQIPVVLSVGSVFQSNAVTASTALQGLYNKGQGLWNTAGWWQSANCLTTLADLTAQYPDVSFVTGAVWDNTWNQAQVYNAKQPSTRSIADRRAVAENSLARLRLAQKQVLATKKYNAAAAVPNKGFLNGYYDDEGWWALAWMRVYDVTKNDKYLRTAANIFDDMVRTGANATCGGIWWDRVRQHNTAIANELFLSVAAHLANRVQNRDYYLTWARNQWQWFQRSGLINSEGTINDGIDLKTCKNNKDTVWTYNQGVILGALTELNRATKDPVYLSHANRIATAAIRKLAPNADGVLHDPMEPNLGIDGPQFKGVFMRNLAMLQRATGNQNFKSFLEKNANSIWTKARNPQNNMIGNVWSGPVMGATASSQSSALDALVAAAVVQ